MPCIMHDGYLQLLSALCVLATVIQPVRLANIDQSHLEEEKGGEERCC